MDSKLQEQCIRIQTEMVRWGHTKSDKEKPHWIFGSFCRAKYGQDVSQVAELKDRYEIEGDNFTINEPSRNDHGNYTCSIDKLNLKADIRVVGKCCWIKLKLKIIHDMHLICSNWFTAVAHLKKLEKTRSVTEGDELRIQCESSGTVAEITWKISELKETLLSFRSVFNSNTNHNKLASYDVCRYNIVVCFYPNFE